MNDLINENTSKRIEVRCLQEIDGGWLNKISAIEGVTELRAAGSNQFVLSMTGKDDVQAKLLINLQRLGLEIFIFKESGMALESLYMSLIKESR